jgi:hypothetical protein
MVSFIIVFIAFFIRFLMSIEGGLVLTYLRNVVIFGVLALFRISYGLNALELKDSSHPWAGMGFGFLLCVYSS